MLDETKTVLFSTHITEDLDKIADYIVMMDNGAITLNEDKETLTENYRLVQTDVLTDEMKAGAIGITKNMFGYTFITKNKNLSGENIKSKIPTMEELFVHLTDDKEHGDDIFVV
jgi:ABC-2 type transport system ATP-binding protein